MNVTVIGTGYVGLVTAVCFAELGHRVVGVDEDAGKVERLRRGEPVIYEPGVESLLRRQLEAGRLDFTTDKLRGVAASEVLFICVGTPPREDGQPDMSQVEDVSRAIAEAMDGYRLLVEKSTVPVKTAQWIERTIRLYNRRNVEFEVASNPEFTREGSAVEDFRRPDRIVIGAPSPRAAQTLLALYQAIECPKIVTDVNTAELIKHASNSFLAMKISFINLIADLCEEAGADVLTVADAVGLDRRIGRAFLSAGLGYGGSCFPKDVKALISVADQLGVNADLLRAVDRLNEARIERLLQKARRALWVIQGKTIAIWGLAFKPNTDDVRGAPALELARRLLAEGAAVRLHDPKAMTLAQQSLPPSEKVLYVNSPLEAVAGAHALVVATEWEEFSRVDLAQVRQRMAAPILIDGRNLFEPRQAREAGFEYHSIGRPAVGELR